MLQIRIPHYYRRWTGSKISLLKDDEIFNMEYWMGIIISSYIKVRKSGPSQNYIIDKNLSFVTSVDLRHLMNFKLCCCILLLNWLCTFCVNIPTLHRITFYCAHYFILLILARCLQLKVNEWFWYADYKFLSDMIAFQENKSLFYFHSQRFLSFYLIRKLFALDNWFEIWGDMKMSHICKV